MDYFMEYSGSAYVKSVTIAAKPLETEGLIKTQTSQFLRVLQNQHVVIE